MKPKLPFLSGRAAACSAIFLLGLAPFVRGAEPRLLVADTFEGGGALKGRLAPKGSAVWSALGNAVVKPDGTLSAAGADGLTATLPIPVTNGRVTLSAMVNSAKSGFVALAFMERGDVKFWNDAALWVAAYPSGRIELRAKNMEITLYTAEPAPGWKKGAPNQVALTFDAAKKTVDLEINGAAVVKDKSLESAPKIAAAGLRFHPPVDGSTATIDDFTVTADGVAAEAGLKDIPVLKPQAKYPDPVKPIEELTGDAPWASDVMTDEPVLFVDPGDGKPVARLLFEPTEILSIRTANLEKSFELGKDVAAPAKGSRELSLPSGSSVPMLKLEELFPAAGSPDAIKAARGERAAKFGEGRFLRWAENPRAFLLKQVVVTYRHSGKWDGFRPQPAPVELKRTISKLERKEPVKIAVIGDSISAGGNASVTMRQSPLLPPYDRLLLHKLRKTYGGEINLVNLAKGGQITEWALTQIPLIVDQKPDLLLIAFGMNDGSGRIKPERFADVHRKLIEGVRAGLPEVDIILVSPIHGNHEWTAGAPDLYPKYAEVLKSFSGPGIAMADVTTPFGQILERKAYVDLTVNGVNHPNDFGHRLYADVIFGLFGK